MLTRPDMPQFKVDMANFTNGDVNTYTVTTKSPLPHFTGDIIWFRFPEESILPTTVVCLPVLALTQIDCTRLSALEVMGVMTFDIDFIEVGVTI